MTLAATARSKSLYNELDRLWSATPGLDSETLGVAIGAARLAHERASRAQEINVVWTGPATEAVPLRRTEQVLEEIIDTARTELLIVSFVVYKVEEVMDALSRALGRGVKLRMVLETEAESGGKISFDQVGEIQSILPEARMYTWPLDNRRIDSKGNYGAIHAKCAVADREVALVSSANLTGFALELNMELGLVVRGTRVASSITKHFEELIRRGILREIE